MIFWKELPVDVKYDKMCPKVYLVLSPQGGMEII